MTEKKPSFGSDSKLEVTARIMHLPHVWGVGYSTRLFPGVLAEITHNAGEEFIVGKDSKEVVPEAHARVVFSGNEKTINELLVHGTLMGELKAKQLGLTKK